MPVHFFFAHRLEPLGTLLAGKLYEGLITAFECPEVVVPNSSLREWLQFKIARTRGCCTEIKFMFLEEVLLKVLSPMTQLNKKMIKCDVQVWALALYIHFSNAVVSEAEMEILLGIKLGEQNNDALKVRRLFWNLAENLGGLFLEYESQRQEMLDQWERQPPMGMSQMAIQARLYLTIRKKVFQNCDAIDFVELRQVVKQAHQLERTTAKIPLHLFGLSSLSPLHLEALYLIGQDRTIHLYLLNVCKEYWSDYQSFYGRDKKSFSEIEAIAYNKDEAGIELDRTWHDEVNPLLQQWGGQGREMLTLLHQFETRSANEFEMEQRWFGGACLQQNHARTLLESVQECIRNGVAKPQHKVVQDDSLQIIHYSNLWDGIEWVACDILTKLKLNPKLCWSDFAILSPDLKSIKPVVEGIFSNCLDDHVIPYHLKDIAPLEQSEFALALLDFFKLAKSEVSRKQVFILLGYNCIQQACGYNRSDLELWLKWMDELGILHHLDVQHKQASGLAATKRYTWSEGLEILCQKMVLSSIPAYLNYDRESLERAVLFFQTLFSDLKTLENYKGSYQTGLQLLLPILRRYFWNPQYRDQTLLEYMEQLQNFDFIEHFAAPVEFQCEDLKRISEMILKSMDRQGGAKFTAGVNVSSIRPMRPIPFEYVYVIGLNESDFPGAVVPHELDLRAYKRKLGDTSLTDKNRYLLLELVMSVKQGLVFGYQGADLVKEEERLPSSCILELQEHLNSDLLKVPFRQLKIAFGHIKQSENSERKGGLTTTEWQVSSEIIDKLPSKTFPKIWPLEIFSKFLDDPLECRLKTHFGLRLSYEELGAVVKEVEKISPSKYNLRNWLAQRIKQVGFEAWLAEDDEEVMRLHCDFPEADFGEYWTKQWRRIKTECLNEPDVKVLIDSFKQGRLRGSWAFGSPRINKLLQVQWPKLKIEINAAEVHEFESCLDCVWLDECEQINILIWTFSGGPDKLAISKQVVEPWLFSQALMQQDEYKKAIINLHVVYYDEKVDLRSYRVNKVQRHEFDELLKNWLAELKRQSSEQLPLRAVMATKIQNKTYPWESNEEVSCEDELLYKESLLKKMEDLSQKHDFSKWSQHIPLLINDHALSMVKSWYQPMMKSLFPQ